MATQIRLFDGELKYRRVWEVTPKAIDEAAGLAIVLFQNSYQVMHTDIAKSRLGLHPTEPVPMTVFEALSDDYGTVLEQLQDMRSDLKDRIEELMGRALVTIAHDGMGARGRGRQLAVGFGLRDSPVGRADSQVQLRMALSSCKQVVRRHPDLLVDGERRVEALETDLLTAAGVQSCWTA